MKRLRIHKSLAILLKANFVAQFFNILSYLILPRLYSPSDFGEFSTFIGIVNIVFIGLSFRLDRAILLPKFNKEGKIIYHSALSIAFFISVFLLIISIILYFNNLFGLKYFIFLIPFLAFITSANESSISYLNRVENYKTIGRGKIIITLSNLVISIISGLFIGEILSRLITFMFFITKTKIIKPFKINSYNIVKKTIIKYKDFPQKSLPAAFFGFLANNIPFIFLAKIYNFEVAGYYFLANKLLSMPTAFIGKPASQFFYKQATKYELQGTLEEYVNKTIKIVILLIVITLTIVYSTIDLVFNFFFNEIWNDVIFNIKVFIPYFAINFLFSIISSIYLVKRKLGFELIMNIFILSVIIMLYLSSYFFNIEAKVLYILSSFIYSLVYVLATIYIYKLTKK